MLERARLAREAGLAGVLVAPMVSGVSQLQALRRAFPDLLLMAHPALGGAGRIAPSLLFGRLFRLFGADATVFPNHGGRFGWSAQTCRDLADAARGPWHGLAPCLPVAAGGMTVERVPEMLDFYGPDVMLLIGGGLLSAGAAVDERTRAFTTAVARHGR